MTQTIQASESEKSFGRILQEVERGETVVITRDGVAVARISPETVAKPVRTDAERERYERAKAGILAIGSRVQLVSLNEILSARDEGRR